VNLLDSFVHHVQVAGLCNYVIEIESPLAYMTQNRIPTVPRKTTYHRQDLDMVECYRAASRICFLGMIYHHVEETDSNKYANVFLSHHRSLRCTPKTKTMKTSHHQLDNCVGNNFVIQLMIPGSLPRRELEEG